MASRWPTVNVIFDVGANIGIYLLLLNQLLARATVFCFEPIPDIFETLRANASSHNHLDLHLLNCGLSRVPGSATFTYYPRSAANSTMYPEMSAENRRNYNQSVLNILNGATSVPLGRPLRMLLAITPAAAKRRIADLVRRYYLRGKRVNCPLRTISEVVDEHHLDRIDLLKIDTEAAESDIVAGVRSEHWPLIRQVVMELHNGEPQAQTMGDFLESVGFSVRCQKRDRRFREQLVAGSPTGAVAHSRWECRMSANTSLRDFVVDHLLARVQTPAQYTGGEWNSVCKDRAAVRGTLCLAFPDLYSIGMSCHAIQVLYEVMNRRADWACERAFTPMPDMEQLLREQGLPLFSLESTTPLAAFDVLGFTLQYDLCYSNVLTMLDLGAVPLRADARTMDHPLVVAGGPCAANPEPMSRFIDLFVLGDGEEALPEVCDLWAELKRPFTKPPPPDAPGPTDDRGFAAGATGAAGDRGFGGGAISDRGFVGSAIDDRGFVEDGDRSAVLAEMASRLPFAYCPRFYRQSNAGDGRPASIRPVREGLPAEILPAVVADLDAIAPPRRRSCRLSSASRIGSPSRSCAAVRASAGSARARR